MNRPRPSVPPAASALSTLPPEAQALSPAARAYHLQLKRIEKLQSQLAELDALEQTHRRDLQQWVHPLELQRRNRMRELVHALSVHLADKVLSRLQRERALAIVCQLAQTLAEEGDREMAALHDRHSPRTLAQKKQAAADALRTRLEAALGAPLDDLGKNASAEALWHAGMARLRQAGEDEQARRRARAQARKARKAPAADQVQQQARQDDADTTLRKLFRQLASALHPDRESDPGQRLRKTVLMSEANAAYGRKDLLALMRLQVQAELADPLAASRLTDDRLAALTLLLKQQVADLERERAARQQRLADEFNLPAGQVPNPNTLKQHLLRDVGALEAAVGTLVRDLALLQTIAGLKRWLNERAPFDAPD